MNRASRDHLCRPAGPAKNAVSATSAKANDGVCVRRHSMCEHFTRMWTQYVQMMPTTNVAAKLNHRPPLAKANGIASMPEPSEPFNRWINVSPSLHTECGWRCALVFVFRARIERKTYDFNIYTRILFSNKKKTSHSLTSSGGWLFCARTDCNHTILRHGEASPAETLNPMLSRSQSVRHSFLIYSCTRVQKNSNSFFFYYEIKNLILSRYQFIATTHITAISIR